MHRVLSLSICLALATALLPSTAMAAFHNGAPTFTNPFAVEVYHLIYWSFATAGIILKHLFTGNWGLIAYDLQLYASICAGHSPLVGGVMFGSPQAMLEATFHFFFIPIYLVMGYLAARFGIGARQQVRTA